MNANNSGGRIRSNAEELIIPPTVTINNQQVIGAISDVIDFKIVGLFTSSKGCFCCMHKTCGEHVCVGNVLHHVTTIIVIGKLVKIIDGMDTYMVGFIAGAQANLPKVVGSINMFCLVIEYYHTCNSIYKRNKGDKNLGMA
jgi:hypothetical protein